MVSRKDIILDGQVIGKTFCKGCASRAAYLSALFQGKKTPYTRLKETVQETPDAFILTSEVMEAAVVEQIAALDFTQLKRKLAADKSWTPEFCDRLEDLYRKFLTLKRLYPEKKIVPTTFLDEFWHAHILDTRAYTRDCEAVFGEYVHHHPYLSDEMPDEGEQFKLFVQSMMLFYQHFGFDPRSITP